ncbi:MAG: TrkH family potassium uptake protein [Tannerella sp.]|jgi:trk system potassium uptake protein TrkH|nr:TrkH family potassium uptake protein [Tannerella sp.]
MSQLNLLFIIKVSGMIHILESFFILIATGVSCYCRGSDFYPLLISFGLMFCFGLICFLAGRKAGKYNASSREGTLIVASTWVLLSFFGMLPFYIGGYIDNITDAFFETMSGFTTTGATILTDIERLPKGILCWRSLTQWQGGIGIIVFTVALVPIFGGTTSQIFDAELSGITHEHFLPRVRQIAKRLFGIYLSLTLILILLLWAGPMNLFDAVNHALTTVSSGGYSTKNSSIAYWNTPYIEYIICIFMCFSATNITLFYFTAKGKTGKLLKDEELRWFYAFVALATSCVTVWLLVRHYETNMEEAFRKSFFQVTSLITTTGYVTSDYSSWGPFFTIIALMLMTVCGCAGSTSGGLKMGRFVILIKNTLNEFKKQTHPNAIIPVRVSNQVIPSDVVHKVLTFTFIYVALIAIGCAILLISGINFEEAIGNAVSAAGNVGISLGKYTNGNFADLPAVSKWTLSFLMLVGRLEIFTVLTLLLPGFWKQ